MNFTREPIIETIISPKEGCKLLVRSSRGGEQAEDYYVDAIEVVSFGHAFFFRSMEKPKAFLVPVSDYEVIEVKEPRVVLKTSSHERNVKIGGGREASLRQSPKEPVVETEIEAGFIAEEGASAEEESEQGSLSRSDKRRDRRRRRHRRSSEEQDKNERKPLNQEPSSLVESAPSVQGGGVEDETKVSSPTLPTLLPPPATLISQTLSRYKGKEFMEKPPLPKAVNEEKKPETPAAAENLSDEEEEEIYPF